MIVRLTGSLAELTEEHVVVERDGVAYEVLVPRFALAELAASRGRTITLHTLEYLEGGGGGSNLIPRMVGFVRAEDRAFFEEFTTVKGIGVRKGLRALGAPVGQIARMIESGDTASLGKLPGVGPQTAKRIVAELRGKLEAFRAAVEGGAVPAVDWNAGQRDAIEVLVAWGDPRHEAERWLARAAQIHPDLNGADEWVRAAYRIKTGAEG